MKKNLLLIIYLVVSHFSYTYSQKSAIKPTNSSLYARSSPGCPLSVSIQDNIPAAECSELLKTLVAITSPCTDTTAVSYRWSSSLGGVFSTSRTATFNLPEFFVNTQIIFSVLVTEGSDTLSANYTINVKPRPNSPTLSPFGTIVLCDNNPVTLTSSACAAGSTTVWSNGISGVNSISVPAIGGTYFSVACYKNGCISDSTAAAALITGIVSSPPTTTNKTICEGTTITPGNGLQANLINCNNGASGTFAYSGPTVGYDRGLINTGGTDPTVNVPANIGTIKKVSISITWRKQKGGYQNDCGVGDTEPNPYHSETQFRIKSPSGRIVTLVNTNTYGGYSNPTVTTVFEDGVPPVNFYSPPVSGTFAPAQPLSGYINENSAGTWTLLPYDAVGKDPLCVSGFSVTFSEAQNGTLTWWDALTGGNQVGTGSEYIPTATAAGTYTYYAQGQCVRGCPSVRTAAILTIQPTPIAPTINVNVPPVNSVRSICNGESITLTATGCNNGGTVRWNSSYNGTNFATGSTYSFVPAGGNSMNVTHSFTAACEGTNLCRSINSTSISVVVKFKPSQPAIFGPGSSICSNASVTLSASTCSGGTLGWTGNRSGSSINFNLTSAVSIKVACTINGCTSDSSNVYSITPLPKPNVLTVNASQVQALCYGSDVTLTASACVGTVKWTGNLTGSPLTLTPLSSRNFKASCLSSNGCSSDSSAALNIIVLPKTKPIITGNSFVCGTSSTTLTAFGCTGANETVVWRDGSTGTTFTETISQTKTYRAVCIRNGYCVSDSSDIFTVQYRIKPSQPIITPPATTTICQGTNLSLTASACVGGTLSWTSGLSGQTINVTPNATRTYKVACLVNGCLSDSSLAVLITINPTPMINVSSNKTSICLGDSAIITVSGCPGTLLWSNGATSSVIKVSPATNTSYTATCTLGSCSSNQSVMIATLLTPNVTASGLLLCGQTVTLTANNLPVGSNIQWRRDGVDVANATNSTFVINSSGGYDFTSYKLQNLSVENFNPNQVVYFIDKNIGFVIKGSNILKTADGGVTWTTVYSVSYGPTIPINSMTFTSQSTGWVVGESGLCLKTIDGGNTWTYIPTSTSFPLKKISFKDLSNGVIVGDFGSIYYTANGGNTWTAVNTFNGGNYPTFLSLSFVPNTTNVWAIGVKASNGFIAKSINSGITWSEVSLGIAQIPANTTFNDITFTTINDGFIVGDNGTIFRTTNGGVSWQLQLSPILSGLKDIQFLNSQIGYICGTFPNGSFLKTSEGNTWKSLNMYAYPVSLSFVDENTGWLTNYGNIIKYTAPQCSTIPLILTTNCCTVFETIKSGSWTDASTWSCNRIPTATDDIFINIGHTITDNGNIIRAKTLNYRGGVLQLSATTNFILR